MRFEEIAGESEFMRRFTSSDGFVTGVVAITDNAVAIHEWQCSNRGQGCTTAALQELCKVFVHVSAIGVGIEPDDPSWQYWEHMRSKGLVQHLEDDGNIPIPRPSYSSGMRLG